jgi:transposase
VDPSVEPKIDKLGRRTGPRRKYSVAQKLQILKDLERPGASVSDVARAHGVNANVVFGWRHMAKRGALRDPDVRRTELLPVKVASPTVLPSATVARAQTGREQPIIEIEFPGGVRVHLRGAVDGAALKRVFEALIRR